ncbi:hypothetical protein DM01DRAFT_266689 [Hesseltinella vesiculosa]|uniref:RING-type domain-containing protein n=1 Tax=Hesseltinella vesiculosa TaxID=101127 RepID=A0A1X2GL74_9FUNG|nr:hypothetical protein DM01DRAFT_266689 [Hesseltinella vesiculosa]
MQQNNGKRPRTVYEERLEVLQNNARQRTNVMKQLSNPQENPSSTLDQGIERGVCQASNLFSQPRDQTCFICNQVLFGDSETINLHIDRCLASMGDEPSPAEPPALHTPQQVDSWDEYEWAGQVRVRASAMMEGGYKGAGFATARKEEDVEEDLDIEDDDNQYGHGQFTEADLIVDDTDDDLAVDDDDLPSTSASSFPPSGNLVVDALKSRVHQLEMATKSVPRCLICLEPYTKPVTSVICWHVHCEKCWLQTLGSKKLCPQCQKITTPGDLRRIYL